jgi:hypothetical protein
MTAQDRRSGDTKRHTLVACGLSKKIELRQIRAPETDCTTASPHPPESHVTHSVMQIVPVPAAVSNQKNILFQELGDRRKIHANHSAIAQRILSFARDANNSPLCKTCGCRPSAVFGRERFRKSHGSNTEETRI